MNTGLDELRMETIKQLRELNDELEALEKDYLKQRMKIVVKMHEVSDRYTECKSLVEFCEATK